MASSHSGDEDSDSMSHNNHLDAAFQTIFFVENFCMDLSQFHSLGKLQSDQHGWTESDASKQIEGTKITEDLNVEAFNVQNAKSFEEENHASHPLHVLLKFTGQKFLVYNSNLWKLFTVQCGRMPPVADMNILQKFVDKCLRKVQYASKMGKLKQVHNFVLMNDVIELRQQHDPKVGFFLNRTCYDGGSSRHSKSVIELKSEIVVSEDSTSMYRALFDGFEPEHTLMTAVQHDSDFSVEKSCRNLLEYCSKHDTSKTSCLVPSEVPLETALKALEQMHDRSWRLSASTVDKSNILLSSLNCDVDYGLFYIKAKPTSRAIQNIESIVNGVKSFISLEFEKSSVFYCPSGKLHCIVGKDGDKPTIEPDDNGVFVKLPDPDHMSEVAKAWFYVKKLPPNFLSDVQNALVSAAIEVLSTHGMGDDQMDLSILKMKSSTKGAYIPGGLLLIVSAFFLLAQMHPDVKLVLETFNGKQKGLFSPVEVDASGTPMLRKASNELNTHMVRQQTIFSFVSNICSDLADLDVNDSVISFGFRTMHKTIVEPSNVCSSIETSSYPTGCGKKSCFPVAFLHPEQSPCLLHLSQSIKRIQIYNESWSALKTQHSRYSRFKTGQNLAKVIVGKTINLSCLRAGLPDLLKEWDSAFQHMRQVGGTRYEVAVRPLIKRGSRQSQETIFDLHTCMMQCWEELNSKFIYFDAHDTVSYGSVCTAAILLGYRASLDALNDVNIDANEQSLIFGYMRYLNSIIHCLPNGRFVFNNPKLYLANLGYDAGRPLALTPTLPFRVRQLILKYLLQVPEDFIDPPIPVESNEKGYQNKVQQQRVQELKDMESLSAQMVMCSCGKGFFGKDRVQKLHDHLQHNPRHSDVRYTITPITGIDWMKTFAIQKQELERWVYTHGSIEQQIVFRNVEKGKNTLCVGNAGTGKTFFMKKIDEYLSMIFLNPGEIVRIAPLGRVAQSFHCEARTLHSTMKLYFNTDSWTESMYLSHFERNLKTLSNIKVLIGLEMFMFSDSVLPALLKYVQQRHPHAMLLFEGDPMQLSMAQQSEMPALCKPEIESIFDTVVFDTQMRISNAEQKCHLDKMRISKADSTTLQYWQSRIVSDDDTNCMTIYALSSKANTHNHKMLQEHENLHRISRSTINAKDTYQGKVVKFSSVIDSQCPAEKVLSMVPNAPVFICRNINAKLHQTSKTIYVGNGTPATCIAIEETRIVVKLLSHILVDIERTLFDLESGFIREQFPLILGWASSIHKVQGMQFQKLRVDFCLDAGVKAVHDSIRPFRAGMAYMALSRSENVFIQGSITLELLNNVNRHALDYWLKKLSSRTLKVQKTAYRDAIHAHNDFCAKKFAANSQRRRCSAPTLAHSPAINSTSASTPVHTSLSFSELVYDIDIDDDPVPASASVLARASAPASESAFSSTADNLVDALAQAHVPAPANTKPRASVSTSAFASVSASTSASASESASASAHAQAPDPEAVLRSKRRAPSPTQPAANQIESASGFAKRPVHTPAPNFDVSLQHRQGVKNVDEKAWFPRRHEYYTDPNLAKTLADLLSSSRDSAEVPQLFRCSKIGHPDTYGEATPELIKFMMQQYDQLVGRTSEYNSTFVDLGSGIGGLVCFIAGLRRFQACFGVENEPNRASYADPLVKDFLGRLQRRSMRYSDIHIRFGDFLKCDATLNYLKRASLVWVNNVAFASINFQLLTILDKYVPIGCVVLSFVSFLPHLDCRNDSGFEKILEYELKEAAGWTGTPQKVHVMQKKR
jgi:hypothetical protein